MENYDFKHSRLHLFPTPTIWTGIGSLMDICGVLNTYNAAPSGAKADYDAIHSDWLAIGDDTGWPSAMTLRPPSKCRRR